MSPLQIAPDREETERILHELIGGLDPLRRDCIQHLIHPKRPSKKIIMRNHGLEDADELDRVLADMIKTLRAGLEAQGVYADYYYL